MPCRTFSLARAPRRKSRSRREPQRADNYPVKLVTRCRDLEKAVKLNPANAQARNQLQQLRGQ
jgi:hypothetical protein